jgi:hypothetical protein
LKVARSSANKWSFLYFSYYTWFRLEHFNKTSCVNRTVKVCSCLYIE